MGISMTQFDYVRDLVRRKSAIVLEDTKQYLVESRLDALARLEGDASVDALIRRLMEQPLDGLDARVVDALTTNETSFFRDRHPFDAMRSDVIPSLMAARSGDRTLRIWCAASSSGQEPFTVAMVLHESFPELAGWNLEILATDISDEMLEKAREGRFSSFEVQRGLSPEQVDRYFSRAGSGWRLAPSIRGMVEFRKLNLIEPWRDLPTMDIILLRNVLIYFDIETRKQILQQVRHHLQPDGFLFLGSSETMISIDDTFASVRLGRAVCYTPAS